MAVYFSDPKSRVDLLPKKKEEEFRRILENYAQFLSAQVRKYDLQKYGLDPDDIMQDIRIRIWKLINDERTIFRQASYIKKIVNSAVIDQFRKLRREDGLFRYEKQKCVAELNPSYNREAARKKMFTETVGRAVERLIDTRRQVVKLYLLDFSIPEISSYLNWSTDKTRNLLYRGLADLRKSLKDCDVKHETRR